VGTPTTKTVGNHPSHADNICNYDQLKKPAGVGAESLSEQINTVCVALYVASKSEKQRQV